MSKIDPKAEAILRERFGKDTLLSLATIDGSRPAVRIVNSYYEDGSFYIITYALSDKIKQIEQNPDAAVCGEWFTAHGVGENLGTMCAAKNKLLHEKLKTVFAQWYNNGHINESDENTIILRIRLTDGILMSHGTRYDLIFR
jgi:general stress protein 26